MAARGVGRKHDSRRATTMPAEDQELLRESLPRLWGQITLSDTLILRLAMKGAITEKECQILRKGDRLNNAKFYELLGFLLKGDCDTLDKFIYTLDEFEDPAVVRKLLREPNRPDIRKGKITTERGGADTEPEPRSLQDAGPDTLSQAMSHMLCVCPFEEQAKQFCLKQTSIDVLVENDYDSVETVSTITNDDLQQLPMSMGQKGLLRKWVAQLQAEQAKPPEDDKTRMRQQPETGLSKIGQSDDGARTKQRVEKTPKKVFKVMPHEHGKTASKYPKTWEAPMCLIDGEDSKLDVNKDAIEALAQVNGPMVVVGVVGLYRTGKSFILNLLAGKTDGFPLGGRTSACTKGLWVWLVEHPTREGSSLLLLDSEGLGDVLKSDENHDMWIFTLAVLLSSTMVYNSRGTIDGRALEDLHFVTKIAQHIKVKTDGKDDSEEFISHFPSFIWAVRDFTLMHDECGSERYLESVLESKGGESDRIERYNQPRECIRRYFPSRTCFCFPFPLTDTRKIGGLEHMREHQLAEEFREVAKHFKEYILENANPKKVQNQQISGTMFGGLVNVYAEALRKGEAPCIQNAVQTTASVENTKAIEESLTIYKTRMSVLKLPTETLEVLSQHHAACETEAIGAFLRRAVFDSDCTFQIQLQGKIMSEMRLWCQENEKSSLAKCEKILDKESKLMREKLQRGDYMAPGGYQLYLFDLSVIEDNFKATENKGVKAAECWDKFKMKKDDEGASIMYADKNMTEQKKQLEEERKQNEAKERQLQLEKDSFCKLEQEREDEKRSKEKHMQGQHEKNVEDKDRLVEELALLRQELERLERQGLSGKAGDMDRRIKAVERDVEKAVEASQPGFLESAWNVVSYAPKKLTSWFWG